MNRKDSLASLVDAILDALDARDLHGARRHFDLAVQRGPLTAVVKQLAATVEIPKHTIVWGFGIDVWANPHRSDYAWRCGDCRWTGSNYRTAHAARNTAETHASDHRISGGSVPAVVEYADMVSEADNDDQFPEASPC